MRTTSLFGHFTVFQYLALGAFRGIPGGGVMWFHRAAEILIRTINVGGSDFEPATKRSSQETHSGNPPPPHLCLTLRAPSEPPSHLHHHQHLDSVTAGSSAQSLTLTQTKPRTLTHRV